MNHLQASTAEDGAWQQVTCTPASKDQLNRQWLQDSPGHEIHADFFMETIFEAPVRRILGQSYSKLKVQPLSMR